MKFPPRPHLNNSRAFPCPRYDCIVVGLSPVAAIVDVCATGHAIDTYVYAVAWGKTKVEVIECGLVEAGNVSSRLPGVRNKSKQVRLSGVHPLLLYPDALKIREKFLAFSDGRILLRR